ncbi:hypothetical protein [Sphaerospermopsis torques-reginae]|uniref:Uncharacterized protein n=1 Tax=Sphaerospermopsis torques-reginae ITEP-024 TaxID=984208 RepID=A0ABX8WZG0_9CYAN|nr:hypothetical protein [Sphaerospermopsis torques-reginae]QYX31826.1 hypothetical protein K2F26_24205 [Sphaerospermopsis torques-reginae ITEP-024]
MKNHTPMIQYHPIATQIYNLLIQDEITKQEGEIIVDFFNISVKINEKSAVGYIFEEWLAEWMRQKTLISGQNKILKSSLIFWLMKIQILLVY